MRKCLLCLTLVLSTLSGFSQGSQPSSPGLVQPPPPQPMTSGAIDTLVARALKAFDVPGIAVAVIKDGKVIHAKGYGVRSLRTMQPVDENTLFGIASNSKAFTVASLGILVDQGRIKWDDKVRDYIPEFKLYDPYVTEEFTIRDLLTHRSGLGLGAGDLMIWPDSSDFTLKDMIHNLRYLKPTSSFRSQYAYDNNLYIIAGEVIARVSGQSWDDFVTEHILRPLGMDHSAPCFEKLMDTSDVIDAHAMVNGRVQVVSRTSLPFGHAAGGINSSIADLSKWVSMHLAEGRYGGQQLLSKSVHDEMWSPQTIIPSQAPGSYNTHFVAYGLGFVVSDVKGYKQLMHNGGLAGMVTQITMIPELGLGIIVLTNQEDDGAMTAITSQIKDSYLGVHGIDRVAQLSQAEKMNRTQANQITDSVWKEINAVATKKTTLVFDAFIGTYKDPWLGEVLISVKNGKLWFDAKRSPKLTGELLPYKGNTFVVKWRDRSMDADAFVIFSLDENGKGAGMTMKPVSPLTDFSFDFQDLEFRRE